MRQPFIVVGAGTDVSTRVILPMCERIRGEERSGDRFPEHVYALIADGDEQTRTAHARAELPADRVPFVPLSLVQVREALAWRRDEFSDAWREPWEDLLMHGPDNGACMVPAIGRMMIKAARPAIMQHLRAFERRLAAQGGKVPEVFVVWSPVSGTSRGSVLDLPRYIRAVWPDAAIHAVVVHPVGVEELDPAVGRIFQTNFIEALRIIDAASSPREYKAWVDDQHGWQSFEARLVDTVFAFDHRYGNTRLRHLSAAAQTLSPDLSDVLARVVDFLAGTLSGEPLWERVRARFADADMHRADRQLAGHRTYLFGVHEARLEIGLKTLKAALQKRAVERLTGAIAAAHRGGLKDSGARDFFADAGEAFSDAGSGERSEQADGLDTEGAY